jgi:hypothetical protein
MHLFSETLIFVYLYFRVVRNIPTRIRKTPTAFTQLNDSWNNKIDAIKVNIKLPETANGKAILRGKWARAEA